MVHVTCLVSLMMDVHWPLGCGGHTLRSGTGTAYVSLNPTMYSEFLILFGYWSMQLLFIVIENSNIRDDRRSPRHFIRGRRHHHLNSNQNLIQYLFNQQNNHTRTLWHAMHHVMHMQPIGTASRLKRELWALSVASFALNHQNSRSLPLVAHRLFNFLIVYIRKQLCIRAADHNVPSTDVAPDTRNAETNPIGSSPGEVSCWLTGNQCYNWGMKPKR